MPYGTELTVPVKYGCKSASVADMRLLGSNWSKFSSRSMAE
jgi:hypothetical protein